MRSARRRRDPVPAGRRAPGGAGRATASPCARRCIVGNDEHRFLVLEQLREIGIEPARVLLEPVGRNTAPALTLAALAAAKARRRPGPGRLAGRPDASPTPAAFTAALRQAVRGAADGAIVILGITPDQPDTGYGYIRSEGRPTRRRCDGRRSSSRSPTRRPPRATSPRAATTWNSGMFVLRASVWLAALGSFRPDIAAASAGRLGRPHGRRPLRAPRRARPSLADPAESGRLRGDGAGCPRQRGSTSAWCRSTPAGTTSAPGTPSGRSARKDADGNAGAGDAMVARQPQHAGARDQPPGRRRSASTTSSSSRRPTRCWSPTAERSQDVKKLVAALARDRPQRAHAASQGAPPLGLVRQHRPGAALPGQAHHGQAGRAPEPADAPPPRRALDRRPGTAEVTSGDRVTMLTENQSTYIPLGADAPARQPGQGAARDHRGAVGLVPRRGRHRPVRGQLRAPVSCMDKAHQASSSPATAAWSARRWCAGCAPAATSNLLTAQPRRARPARPARGRAIHRRASGRTTSSSPRPRSAASTPTTPTRRLPLREPGDRGQPDPRRRTRRRASG